MRNQFEIEEKNQKELFLSAQRGCQKAREQLILSNQGLVVYLVKRINVQDGWEDLIQEGNLGLMKAIERFDPELGYSFSTYASWWIKQSIQNYLQCVRPLISVGKGLNQALVHADRIRQEMMQELSREIEDEELADKMNMSLEKLRKLQKTAFDCGSLFLNENEKINEIKISEVQQKSLHDEVIQKQTIEYLLLIISYLSEREQKILYLHYGIKDQNQMTLQEIADQMNLCKERIRQIENQALKKLRLFFEQGMKYNEDKVIK